MTEILKGFSLSFGGRDPGGFGCEGTFFRAVEDGAAMNMGLGRMVAEFPVPEANDVYVITFVGIQAVYYRRPAENGVEFPYAQGGGIHMGGGFVMGISPGVAMRTQFSILNGPARSVLLEIGVEFPL